MKAGSLKIEVESDYTFAEGGQEPRGVCKEEGSAYPTLVGIEGYGLHDASGRQPEGADLAKAACKVSCFSQAMMF